MVSKPVVRSANNVKFHRASGATPEQEGRERDRESTNSHSLLRKTKPKKGVTAQRNLLPICVEAGAAARAFVSVHVRIDWQGVKASIWWLMSGSARLRWHFRFAPLPWMLGPLVGGPCSLAIGSFRLVLPAFGFNVNATDTVKKVGHQPAAAHFLYFPPEHTHCKPQFSILQRDSWPSLCLSAKNPTEKPLVCWATGRHASSLPCHPCSIA